MSSQLIKSPSYGNRQWKAPVASSASLPSSAQEGDVRLVLDTAELYSYDGSSWNVISGGGGGSITIQTPLGTSPVGSLFTLETSNSSVDITGNSTTDTIDFAVKSSWVRGLLSVSNPLTYNSSTGAFGVDITSLTEDTTPDVNNDFVMTYDASASALKKVKLVNLGTGGGGLSDSQVFGSGADGDLTISSGTTSLTAYVSNYDNITITGTAEINLNGGFLLVKTLLDLENAPANAIRANGSNATNANQGAAGSLGAGGGFNNGPAPSNTVVGTNGATGGTATTGVAPSSQSIANNILPNSASNGNSGNGGGNGAGGSGGSGGGTTGSRVLNYFRSFPFGYIVGGYTTIHCSIGGRGGASGSGDGTNGGGGGGGGGGAGGAIKIYAKEIKRSSSTTAAGAISAKGGNGGNGGTRIAGNVGGGGAGAGGGGGFIYIAYKTLSGSSKTGLICVDGGSGGTGGNGVGTGAGGNGGGSGHSGEVNLVNLTSGTLTTTAPVNGSAGTAASGGTGGAGASTNTSSVDL